MALCLLLLLCCLSCISFSYSSEDVKQGSNILRVYPSTPAGLLVRRMDDTLNLTCSVTGNSSHMNKFKIEWVMPFSSKNSKNRVYIVQEQNNLTLSVKNLQESDTGDYKCLAVDNNQTTLQEVIRVNVKRKRTMCSDNMFQCAPPGSECIMKIYVCDGRPDCPDGTDEAPNHCGQDACEGKLRCENGRCIPYEWCCDDFVDPNCTAKFRLPCCRKLITGCVLCVAGDMDADGYPPSEQQRYNDMGFLQTTIYTVIGCAMAFMFIVTVLVIAICRVHMKRSVLSRCPGAMLASRASPSSSFPSHLSGGRLLNLPRAAVPPFCDLDVFLSRSAELSQPSHSGLLVTYNINNGVQFVGRPVDPPPYSEILSTPPREGPPPPYTSRENLTTTTADNDEIEDNSNEGDRLLGNSHRNQSPMARVNSSTIQATVENCGEAEGLLEADSAVDVLPSNYITPVQDVVANPSSLTFSCLDGREISSSDSCCTDTADQSVNNSRSSDFSDQPSSSLSDSSLGQILPYVVSGNSDDCLQTSAVDILSNDDCSSDSISNQICNDFSPDVSNVSNCIESGKEKDNNFIQINKENADLKGQLNLNISSPVDASRNLTTPSMCKISVLENIDDCVVDSHPIGVFTHEDSMSISVDPKPRSLISENT